MEKDKLTKLKSSLRKAALLRRAKRFADTLALRLRHALGGKDFDLGYELEKYTRKYYVLYYLEPLCNFRCSYCIQKDLKKGKFARTDPGAILEYLLKEVRPRERSILVSGGEVTLNPDLRRVVETLCGAGFDVTVDSNLGTGFYDDFDGFISWAKKAGARWSLTYHPEFLDADIFIDRVRRMKSAGIRLGWIVSVDTPYLGEAARRKLESAGIGFRYQEYFGLDAKTGELLPKSHVHPGFDYEKYTRMSGRKYRKACTCRNIPDFGNIRHFIAPDGNIYNCRNLLYAQKHPVGHVNTGWPEKLLEPFRCEEYGWCDFCDMFDMEPREDE